jgi:hypothetical protein
MKLLLDVQKLCIFLGRYLVLDTMGCRLDISEQTGHGLCRRSRFGVEWCGRIQLK